MRRINLEIVRCCTVIRKEAFLIVVAARDTQTIQVVNTFSLFLFFFTETGKRSNRCSIVTIRMGKYGWDVYSQVLRIKIHTI